VVLALLPATANVQLSEQNKICTAKATLTEATAFSPLELANQIEILSIVLSKKEDEKEKELSLGPSVEMRRHRKNMTTQGTCFRCSLVMMAHFSAVLPLGSSFFAAVAMSAF
jgi:hypothetical protein